MFLSIVIPSIGRKSLQKTINSIIQQKSSPSDYEIILVAQEFDPEDILVDIPTQINIIFLKTDKRIPTSHARNTGAALAKGNYLHFLDDDDWMAPGAISSFQKVIQNHPNAPFIYGGCEFYDGKNHLLGALNLGRNGNCLPYLLAGCWIPVSSPIIESETFFSLGGFDPNLNTGQEDYLFCRLSIQYDFVNLDNPVTCVLRGEGWNTSTDDSIMVDNLRTLRNNILDQPNTIDRLKDCELDPYWEGRIMRIYLSSCLMKLRKRNFTKCFSRSIHAIKWIFSSNRDALHETFRQGFLDHHPPQSGAYPY